MPASVMTMPQAKVAVQMHRDGYSQPQIAAALNLSRSAVRTGLKHMGVHPRTQAEGYRSWLLLRGGRGTKAKIQEASNAG